MSQDDLIEIEIDGQNCQAKPGQMLIEVADANNIRIPRFCYHKKLSVAANCRMCLVEVEKAPKPLPACATPVTPGMKVYTRSETARKAQKGVMEFLLINHPLDCPICDQGGECELQDLAMGYGRSVSRFTEQKRVVKDKNVGALVSTDMTRCIHCTRCVRFLEEVAGTSEFGGIGRGDRTEIGTFVERSIDSELSGNLIDVCPVGALTNKPFRFRARAWEMMARPAVSFHDALGSNQYLHIRQGEIMRCVPRDNESVNENWLSDRDRYAHFGLQAGDRLMQPMIRKNGQLKEVSWDEATEAAAALLKKYKGNSQGLVNGSSSNEELLYFQRLLRHLDNEMVDHRWLESDFSDQQNRAGIPSSTVSPAELAGSDVIVLFGCNPRHEIPLLGHRVRQAWRNGARILDIGSYRHDHHFDTCAELIDSPLALAGHLAALQEACRKTGRKKDAVTEMARQIKNAEKVVFVFGQQAAMMSNAGSLRQLLADMASEQDARLLEISPYANAAGAWAMGAVAHRHEGGRESRAGTALEILQAEGGCAVVFALEPGLDCLMSQAMDQYFQQANALLAFSSWRDPQLMEKAEVILPLATGPERDASMVNYQGLLQLQRASIEPAGDSKAGWRVIRAIADKLNLSGFDADNFDQLHEEVREQIALAAELKPAAGQTVASEMDAEPGLQLLRKVPLYAGDALTRRSAPLQQTVLASCNCIEMNQSDAADIDVSDGDTIWLKLGKEELRITARVTDRLPVGTLCLPVGAEATRSRLSESATCQVRRTGQ